MSDIRYGIIGTGMMGVEHIENIKVIDGATVAAVADTNETSLATAVEACEGEVRAFEDYRELLESGGCDAIVVATPNHTHIDVLVDVLETEAAVMIEKPLCTTVEDCETVASMAANRSAPVWVALEYRYMPPVARLIEEVHAGAVGDVKMVAIREHRFPFLTKVDDWNRFSANTGGTLVEKCCHFFDLMALITQDEPTRVFASGAQDVNHLDEVYDGRRSDILDNAYVIVDFKGGSRAMLDLSMFAEATHNQEEISVVGDEGKLEALVPEGVIRRGRRGTHFIGGVEILAVDADVGHVGLHHGSSYIEHVRFRDMLINGTKPEVTVADGLRSVAVGVAAHRSIDEGRPVDLKEVLGH